MYLTVGLKQILDERLLLPGDHIAVEGEMVEGIIKYHHHGIFISHSRGVIDFGAWDIRNVSLNGFSDMWNRKMFKLNYPPEKCLPPERVVEIAEKLLISNCWPAFNVLMNNCEHFATFCKTGEKHSLQVIKSVAEAVAGTVAVGTALSLCLAGGAACVAILGSPLVVPAAASLGASSSYYISKKVKKQ